MPRRRQLAVVARPNGIDILDDADAVNVVNAYLEYFEVIGAIGPEAGLDDVV